MSMSESRLVPDFEARISAHAARVAREEGAQHRPIPVVRRATPDERRADAEAMLIAHPDWSNRVIAAASEAAYATVGRLRAKLIKSGQIPDAAKRVGVDGNIHASLKIGKWGTRDTRREAVKTMLMAHPDWTNEWIRAETGASREMIIKTRKRLVESGEIPDVPERVGASGKIHRRVCT